MAIHMYSGRQGSFLFVLIKKNTQIMVQCHEYSQMDIFGTLGKRCYNAVYPIASFALCLGFNNAKDVSCGADGIIRKLLTF